MKQILLTIVAVLLNLPIFGQASQNNIQKELFNIKHEISRIDSIQDISCVRVEKLIKEQIIKDDKLKEELKQHFYDANQILLHRERTVDLWLTIIAIVASLIAIAFPIAAYGFFDSYKKKSAKFEHDFEKFHVEMEKKSKQYEALFRQQRANLRIEVNKTIKESTQLVSELKEYQQKGKGIHDKMEEMYSNNRKSQVEREKAVEVANSISKNEEATTFQKSLAKAYSSYYEDKWDNALVQYLDILTKFKDEISTTAQLADIYYKIGYCYLSKNQNIEAISYFEKHNEITRNNYNSLCNTGYAYQNLYADNKDNKEYMDKALQYYEIAEKLNHPIEDSWIVSKRAAIDMTNNDYISAIEKYKRAIELNPTDDSLILSLIECAIFANKIDDASNTLSKHLNIHPNFTFEVRYLQSLLDLIVHKESDEKFLYNSIKECCGENKETIDWDLKDLLNWLDSEASGFLGEDIRYKIKRLHDLIEEWNDVN